MGSGIAESAAAAGHLGDVVRARARAGSAPASVSDTCRARGPRAKMCPEDAEALIGRISVPVMKLFEVVIGLQTEGGDRHHRRGFRQADRQATDPHQGSLSHSSLTHTHNSGVTRKVPFPPAGRAPAGTWAVIEQHRPVHERGATAAPRRRTAGPVWPGAPFPAAGLRLAGLRPMTGVYPRSAVATYDSSSSRHGPRGRFARARRRNPRFCGAPGRAG